MADCPCTGVEAFLRSDTGNEFTGVGVECEKCGRDFVLDDVCEPAAAAQRALNAQKRADMEKHRAQQAQHH